LSAAHSAQAALGVLSPYLSQPLAAQVVAGANEGNHPAGEVFPLAIRRQIDDAQIYPQRPACWLLLLWRFPALGDMQVVDASVPDQIGPADFPCRVYQHRVLACAQEQAADDTALQGVEGNPVEAHQAVGAGVVADAATWPKSGARVALLGLDRFNCFHRL